MLTGTLHATPTYAMPHHKSASAPTYTIQLMCFKFPVMNPQRTPLHFCLGFFFFFVFYIFLLIGSYIHFFLKQT